MTLQPITFPEVNLLVESDSKELQDMPIHYDNSTREGKVVSCWYLPWWRRLRFLFTGELWLVELTFNQPVCPKLFTDDKKEIFE